MRDDHAHAVIERAPQAQRVPQVARAGHQRVLLAGVRQERHPAQFHALVERIAACVRGIDPHRVRFPLHEPRAPRGAAVELFERVLSVRMHRRDRDEDVCVRCGETEHVIVRDVDRRAFAVDGSVLAVAVIEREDRDAAFRDGEQPRGELLGASIDVLDAGGGEVDPELESSPRMQVRTHRGIELAAARVGLRTGDVRVDVEEERGIDPFERPCDERARLRARVRLEIRRNTIARTHDRRSRRRAGDRDDDDRAEEDRGCGEVRAFHRGVSRSTVPAR